MFREKLFRAFPKESEDTFHHCFLVFCNAFCIEKQPISFSCLFAENLTNFLSHCIIKQSFRFSYYRVLKYVRYYVYCYYDDVVVPDIDIIFRFQLFPTFD